MQRVTSLVSRESIKRCFPNTQIGKSNQFLRQFHNSSSLLDAEKKAAKPTIDSIDLRMNSIRVNLPRKDYTESNKRKDRNWYIVLAISALVTGALVYNSYGKEDNDWVTMEQAEEVNEKILENTNNKK